MEPHEPPDDQPVSLPVDGSLWETVYVPAPLIVVGTVDDDGTPDLAPKHQATPLGWADHYGFVCTARHRTHANVRRTGQFTVSFPTPDQVVLIGQAAAPRVGDEKRSLAALQQFPASCVDGTLMNGASLWLECELDRMVAGFGDHDLIVGRIVRAAAPSWAIRDPDRDDAELLRAHPPLAYLVPDRFARLAETRSFPFPAEFSR